MPFFKKHISLIFALLIPVAMIVFVAISIYLPGLFIRPHFNFVYETGPQYNYGQASSTVRQFVYDIVADTAREVSPGEVTQLRLNSDPVSPDGYTVSYGSRSESFLFFFGSYTDYSTHYLTGHGAGLKLNIPDSSGYNNFRFIGWITP